MTPCGTFKGYRRHRRRGEDACQECKAANARYVAKASRPGSPRYQARGRLAHFYDKVTLPDENGCMLWRGTKNRHGYGETSVDGKRVMAHRVTLLEAEGQSPDPDRTEAAHSCRNTDCVAPAHLRWATRVENMADKKRDGTEPRGARRPNAKLTDAQVIAIRHRYAAGGVTHQELADELGVHHVTVGQLLRRETWRHLEMRPT